ncbi:hypothetical protein ENSA5_50110 [Enhygromyxa salina]|uniref:Uncharacterized protein n=1 Tax=Enhygromyxa salina TaxID=215803 RepID=A0A2S9XHF1_9BACT|nr:hypothetical protein ENSA5_50110 [Enhygromyxa salina]
MTASTASGTSASGTSVRMLEAGSRMWQLSILIGCLAEKGSRPVSISKPMHASAYMSARPSSSPAVACSGAM